jgi:hypothetical protein
MTGSLREIVGAWICCGLIAIGAVTALSISSRYRDPGCMLSAVDSGRVAAADRRAQACPGRLGSSIVTATPREKPVRRAASRTS